MRRHLRKPANATSAPGFAPSGATLVEVLMSLLIMSIGITSVFYLFPIALLSSIKANQLTNTRILADQADAVTKAHPQLMTGAKEWQPLQTYNINDIVVPRVPPGNSIPTTPYYFRLVSSASTPATSGLTEPSWTDTDDVPDSGLSWRAYRLPVHVNDPSNFINFRYIIDPFGYANAPTFPNTFGNTNGARPDTNRVLRINGGLNPADADRLNFSLPDTWNVIETVFPTSYAPSSVPNHTDIVLPSTIDVSTIPIDSSTQISRVVALSPDGRTSAAGTITQAVGNTIRVRSPLLDSIGQIRIETFTRRYTWLAAVHRDNTSGTPEYQFAIIFNRRFSIDDEKLYPCSFYSDPTVITSNETIPDVGYVFDTLTVRWHKVVSHTAKEIVITPALEGSIQQRQMMFLPGIVKVFPLDQ